MTVNAHHSTNPTVQHLGDHLNPRRLRQCERLLSHVVWHLRKIHIDSLTIGDLCKDCHMEKFQLFQAVDDLYALGVIEIKVGTDFDGGDRMTITALADSIDIHVPRPEPGPRLATKPEPPAFIIPKRQYAKGGSR